MNTQPLPTSCRILALAGIAAVFAGCASEPASRVVTAPPPPAPATTTQTVVVPTTPAATAPVNPGATIIVQQQPPTVQAESPPPRPSDQHVWVSGYWAWENSRYVWVSGRWLVPPRAGATWVPPRWEPEGRGYRFYDGYWS